ncbi:MAG TPA: crotonase/enoyl-CoA hydratase family protein [Acidimicrobiales bacterium]|jgi:enoyl-CoA hydratase|nr:crotonase/enoyl-CoA hydratase family protein [Acidimicrobiales bacterium]
MGTERPTSEVLSCTVADGVATLVLDRAEKRNALGPAFWSDLPRFMADLDRDDDVRCVVIAAAGPHFSVGLDLTSFGGLGEATAGGGSGGVAANRATFESIVRMQASVSAVAACRKPVVAAVHGYCIGGGVDLIAACDVRLAADDAVFSVRETKIAIVADLGSLQRLPRLVGAGHLAELALTGKDIDAERAKAIGLVNDVYPGGLDAVRKAAVDLAAEIAANSPLAVQGTKAVLAANDGRTVAEGLEYVAWWNSLYLHSADLTEAMTAFFEKRPPRFTGR